MVPLEDVRDFVGEHAGQFALIPHPQEHSLRDEHITARNRKGVHIIRFKDTKTPGQVCPLSLKRKPHTDVINIVLDLLVIDERRGT